MKKRFALALAALLCFALLAGCAQQPAAPAQPDPAPETLSETDSIPFADGQLYAAAYLGYAGGEDLDRLSYYAQKYLGTDGSVLPVHQISGGEYWLILPRYGDMTLQLYRNDMETMEQTPVFEQAACEAFVLECNVSDIFPDATVCLTRGEETVSFSPYLSLKDGSAVVGERGLDLSEGLPAPESDTV